MRHKKVGRKLGVKSKHRKSMFRNMATDLFRHESIRTTDKKAKEIRRVAEKLVTLAKDGSLHARRRAAAYVRDKETLAKLFNEIAEKFKERPGGYTRIIKLGYRKGDNTPMSLIELVSEEYKPRTRKKKTDKKTETPKGTEPEAKSTKKKSAKDLGLLDEQEAPGEHEQKVDSAAAEGSSTPVTDTASQNEIPASTEPKASEATDPDKVDREKSGDKEILEPGSDESQDTDKKE